LCLFSKFIKLSTPFKNYKNTKKLVISIKTKQTNTPIKQRNTKFQGGKNKMNVGDLLPIGITLVVVTVALAFGLQVLGDIKGDMTANSAEANATSDGITGLSKLTGKLPTIGLVLAAVVVIGILVR
jgi:hypothetical protein